MSWPTPPSQGADPWYAPFLTMWSNLKTYIDTALSGKSDTSHNHSGTYDAAGTASSAVAAHAGAADPHTGYALESALGGAAALNVGTTAGTVAAGNDSRFTDSRTPSGSAGGDLSGTYPNPSVASDAVSNAKLANVASGTIKGRSTAGTGDPEDLTGAQATALLDVFTSSAKGLVPASGGGTTNFLRADGTFAAPSGGGGGYAEVQEEGSALTARTKLNFIGSTVTAADNAGNTRTNVTVSPGFSVSTLSSDPTTLSGDAGYITYASGTYASSSGTGKAMRLVNLSESGSVRSIRAAEVYRASSGTGRCGVAIGASTGGSMLTAFVDSAGKVKVMFVYLWTTDFATYYTSTLTVSAGAAANISLFQHGALWHVTVDDGVNYETAQGSLDGTISGNARVGVYFKDYTGSGIYNMSYGMS